MNSVALESLSVQSMVDLLTVPYRRGTETLVIPLGADGANGTDVKVYDFKEYRARYSVDPAEPKYVRIPVQSCHPFQTNAATHSILKLPLIPVNVATPWW